MKREIIQSAQDGDVIFEPSRLLYRRIESSDAEQIFRMDSNPEVMRYIFIPPASAIEESIEFTRNIRKQYDDNGTGRLAVVEKKSNAFIGWAGIKFHTDTMDGKSHFYELGYRFLQEYWGRGYGTEAAQALACFAFTVLDVPSLAGSAHVDHGASNRLLEKAGLRKSHEFDEDGERWTWYEVSKEDWLVSHMNM